MKGPYYLPGLKDPYYLHPDGGLVRYAEPKKEAGMSFVIGLDLDGVCYHFDRTARYMLRQHMLDNHQFPPAELHHPSTHWDHIRDLVGPDNWKWLWSEGVKNGLFRYGHVVSGAIEGVQALNKMGDVVAITARPKQAVHDTLVWLATMFDKAPLSGLVIQSHGQSKSEVLPAPHVYIDDAVHNAQDVLANTKARIVMFNQPWNQSYVNFNDHGHRVIRAYGWRDVVQVVRDIKEAL